MQLLSPSPLTAARSMRRDIARKGGTLQSPFNRTATTFASIGPGLPYLDSPPLTPLFCAPCPSTHIKTYSAVSSQALHALSLDHYRVFIQNQECVRHVRAQGKEMEGHLSSLLTEVRVHRRSS